MEFASISFHQGKQMKKIAAEYFKDFPELVEDLDDKSKYTTHNSIHRMAE